MLAILVQAESAELKARFFQRKPMLGKMKNQGWIGEDNLGFLSFRNAAGQSQENVPIVQAENKDRKTVYAEITIKVKTSAEEVGKRRAAQIAALAAAGQWLQDSSGNWYQKKVSLKKLFLASFAGHRGHHAKFFYVKIVSPQLTLMAYSMQILNISLVNSGG